MWRTERPTSIGCGHMKPCDTMPYGPCLVKSEASCQGLQPDSSHREPFPNSPNAKAPAAKMVESEHAGVIALSRYANPAIGEYGAMRVGRGVDHHKGFSPPRSRNPARATPDR